MVPSRQIHPSCPTAHFRATHKTAGNMPQTGHNPVMLSEVLAHITPKDGEIYVDGTFGAGGYTSAILEAADCRVIAIDRDEDAAPRAQKLKEKYGDRLIFIHGEFGDVEALIKKAGFEQVNGFVLDLGVSSFQLDQAERGFSFRFDGPLDMRMDVSKGETAADIVNTYAEEKLANLIYEFGEERLSRRIAKKIVERSYAQKFTTTFDLAELVRSCVPKSGKDKIDPATRTFQALRIAVNDELGELDRALEAAENILAPEGRLVVVSFHSLEDRRVKQALRKKSGMQVNASRHLPHIPGDNEHAEAVLKLLTKKAIEASAEETQSNPRSRSAKLRAAVRVGGAL